MDKGYKKPPKIKIEIPKSSFIPSDVWEDLESYLFTGFLHSRSTIGGSTYVFKSLNHHEIQMIEFSRPFDKDSEEARSLFRASFIAYSIFMANGRNVLHDRPNHIYRLINSTRKIPIGIQNKIIENLSYINSKANKLYPLVEVYTHESRSRYKWYQYRNSPIGSVHVSGIHGCENLGPNHAQLTWVALNRIEDRREDSERDWSNAKFIGSCFAGKGVRSIDDRDKARADTEKKKIDDRRMKVLGEYINGKGGKNEEPLPIISLPDGRRAEIVSRKTSETVEELAADLSNTINNQKDEHDMIVERHMERMRIRAQEIQEGSKKMLSIPSSQVQGDESGVRVIGSKEQALNYIERMNQIKIENVKKFHQSVNEDQNSDEDDLCRG